ncbi:hypothetical protein D5086_005969 [Populus alba]|uniref:Uncharacterized protein n=1 Tax=Populus alba TaxID=43335 RepID=A0ACC4CK09_POPAL
MEEEESSKWDYDGKVTPEEVAAAAMYLKDTSGKEGIQELISCCDVLEGCFHTLESLVSWNFLASSAANSVIFFSELPPSSTAVLASFIHFSEFLLPLL